MCGRYTNLLTWREIVELYRIVEPAAGAAPNLAPRYNAAPTDLLPMIRRVPGGRHLSLARWGLAPFWMRQLKGPPLINARAESIEEKPAFRGGFRNGRRCLVPADGFYEWAKIESGKQPYRIVMADGGPMTFAGLWETNGSLGIDSFTIITTTANGVMSRLHDRMPVLLDEEAQRVWLGEAEGEAGALLKPAPDAAIRYYPVDRRVGSVKHDDAALVEPLAPPSEAP
jgi:putative SOS response-associated peptidase YedK